MVTAESNDIASEVKPDSIKSTFLVWVSAPDFRSKYSVIHFAFPQSGVQLLKDHLQHNRSRSATKERIQ